MCVCNKTCLKRNLGTKECIIQKVINEIMLDEQDPLASNYQ